MVISETTTTNNLKSNTTRCTFLFRVNEYSDIGLNILVTEKSKQYLMQKSILRNGILKSYKRDGFGFYKLLLKSENTKTIGISGLVKRKELDDADIGFGFLPDYEGKGFGS